MKLGTLANGTRDGELVLVRSDLSTYTSAKSVAACLQDALDRWDETEPHLRRLADDLEKDRLESKPSDFRAFHSPLPRAYEWVDGSSYLNHVRLVRKARGAEPPPTLETDPLVYQGGSSVFLRPWEDLVLPDVEWGMDFESEVCVILGDMPRGTSADNASKYIRLVMTCNDVTHRNLIPNELAKGFGFFQSKPATAFSPVAVTPDELGSSWREGRLHMKLRTQLNGKTVGDTWTGPEMHFSFFQLMEHIAKTRAFSTGTILGSGTVSNEDRSRGISCLAEQRMIETIENGKPSTPFLKPGDRVEIELLDSHGRGPVGKISQKVVAG